MRSKHARIAKNAEKGTGMTTVQEGVADFDGVRIYHNAIGRGEPLLLLHGGPGLFHDYFLPHLTPLAKAHRLVFFDQRGGGRSVQTLRPEDLTIAEFTADIERLRDHLGLGRIHLLGHSWGGLLALNYAIKYPQALGSIILVDSAAPNPKLSIQTMLNRQKQMAAVPELAAVVQSDAFRAGDPEAVETYFKLMDASSFFDRSLAPRLEVKFTRETAAAMLSVSSQVFPQMAAFDAIHGLARVKAPTLIIHGTHDFIPLESARLLHEGIPGSRLAVFEDCGHYPFVEQPGRFLAAVRDFLADAPADHRS